MSESPPMGPGWDFPRSQHNLDGTFHGPHQLEPPKSVLIHHTVTVIVGKARGGNGDFRRGRSAPRVALAG